MERSVSVRLSVGREPTMAAATSTRGVPAMVSPLLACGQFVGTAGHIPGHGKTALDVAPEVAIPRMGFERWDGGWARFGSSAQPGAPVGRPERTRSRHLMPRGGIAVTTQRSLRNILSHTVVLLLVVFSSARAQDLDAYRPQIDALLADDAVAAIELGDRWRTVYLWGALSGSLTEDQQPLGVCAALDWASVQVYHRIGKYAWTNNWAVEPYIIFDPDPNNPNGEKINDTSIVPARSRE